MFRASKGAVFGCAHSTEDLGSYESNHIGNVQSRDIELMQTDKRVEAEWV